MERFPTFEIRNLLSTIGGVLTLKPLTVLTGPDQDGRTQALYALHWFLQEPPESGALEQQDIEEIMHAPQGSMPGASFRKTGGDAPPSRESILLPATRTGIHLFYRELMYQRTQVLHQASRRPTELHALLAPARSSQYPTPVARYLDWLGCLPEIRENPRGSLDFVAQELEEKIVKGTYLADPQTGNITFQHNRKGMNPTPLHRAPGYASSLMPLWHYLRFQAGPRQALFIEEAESMLQPTQQEALTHMMLYLDRCGIEVVMTTSSPVIEKEAKNMVARKSATWADPGECAIYRFQDGTIKDITPEQASGPTG